MVDNFDKIEKLLDFKSDDEFYFIQVLQRKKDVPKEAKLGSNNSSRLIKAYYINSLEQLHRHKFEMIALAKLFNARIGINLNKRSYYKTAFNTLKHIAEQMHNKQFTSVHRAWNTCCGIHNGGDKIWILDIDEPEVSPIMLATIEHDCSPKGKDKFIAKLPSKSGWHVITTGFDLRLFKERYPEIEIHKNNPTNLYIP